MIIHYTLTSADYREARQAMGFSRYWLRYGVLAWIGLILPALAASEWSAARKDPSAPATNLLSGPEMLPLVILLVGWVSLIVMSRRQTVRCRDISNATRWVLVGMGIMGIIAGLAMLITVPSRLSDSFWAWIGLTVIYLVVFSGSLFGGADRKIWNALVDQHRPKQLELTTEGIVLADGVSRGEYYWDAFLSSRETKDLFVLVLNPYSMVVAPKRAFPDAGAANAFATALKQNIVPRTGGFPVCPCPRPLTPTTDLPMASLAARNDVQP